MSEASSAPDGDIVSVQVPADVVYVSTLRLTAAGLAARCELTIDDIEDLRLAVDEACALLLPNSTGSTLDARFELSYGSLQVTVGVEGKGEIEIDRSGFAWTVLGALATDLDVASSDGKMTIRFTKRRVAGVA
ncbi:MAG: serine/threonine-protein kinase RsbW [Pseudonocardiales bacterium]|nr:serine/threonine-protein kinase RsbW [Pseudonocardiales bacterium]